jgi:DNA-binding NarL/FixJ family response regulator
MLVERIGPEVKRLRWANRSSEPGRRSSGAARGFLTAREQEVVALIVEGLTNRQIAEHLVISERTAEHHVESILNKLGLASRAQVAAWSAAARQNVH